MSPPWNRIAPCAVLASSMEAGHGVDPSLSIGRFQTGCCEKDVRMTRFLAIVALAGGLAACNANSPGDRAVAGGLIGAGTGAVVGGVASGTTGGALAGAAIGGAGGAIIGAATTPERRARARWCQGTDAYGRLVEYRC
jgi:hypothetical protein